MTRKIVPFHHWHYEWLPPAVPGQERIQIGEPVLADLEKHNSWTAVVDGDVIACAGTMQDWPGRHRAWAFMTYATKDHMLWLTRSVREKISELKGRIEFTVRADFAAGHRWAHLLEFGPEAHFVQWGPEGEDHIQYVRFQ